MTLITGSIAPAASAVAQTTGGVSGGPSQPVATSQQAATQTVTSGQASVVSLSAGAKSRGASSGEGRSVDATFEKQESSAENKAKAGSNEEQSSGTLVNIEA